MSQERELLERIGCVLFSIVGTIAIAYALDVVWVIGPIFVAEALILFWKWEQ